MNDHLVIKLGREYLKIDLVTIMSEQFKKSKSDIRRLIKQGALVLYAPKGTKWEEL